MQNENLNQIISKVKENLKPGITVALVSIPLSIAISIASGAGPVPGIITGFWATIIASLFGGSKYNIIGPAGALTSILFAATVGGVVGINGAQVLPVIALLTGLMIFLIYILRGERCIRYIPASVVHGFAAGVAFSIASSQLREAFGIVGLFKPSGEFVKDMENVIANIPNLDPKTFFIFISFFIALLLWKKYIKNIPGVIPASLIGIVLGFSFKTYGVFESVKTVGDRYGELSLSLIQLPNFSILNQILTNPQTLISILKVSFVVAVVAILETLITAKIGDKITGTKFDVRKEARGLSLANIFSGLFGGLPATGVFIRTGLNIKSGATEKYAGVIAGVVTGLGALIFIPFIKYIPMSVIAAMLMMTAIGLVDVKHFRHMFDKSRKDFYIGIVTVSLVLIFDAGIAVLVGTVVTLMYLLEKTTDGTSEVSYYNHDKLIKRVKGNKVENYIHKDDSVTSVVYSIGGFLSYIDSDHHNEKILKIAQETGVKKFGLRFRNMDYADFEALEELAQTIHKIESKHINIFLSSVSDSVKQEMLRIKTFQNLFDEKKVYMHTVDALK